jgi:ribose transport system permease protein
MMMGRTTAGTSTHGLLYELDAIAAVVVGGTLLIGGRGTIMGTVLGVLIFSTLTNVFTQNNMDTSVQALAKGLIIVVAVLLQQRFAARNERRATAKPLKV